MPNDRGMVKLTFIDHLLSARYCDKHIRCSPHFICTKPCGVSTLVILILQVRKYPDRLRNLPKATQGQVSKSHPWPIRSPRFHEWASGGFP